MNPATISLIQTLLNVVFGVGFGGFFLKYLIDRRKLTLEESEDVALRKRSDFDRALEVVTHQRDDALKLVNECYSRLEKMELEVQGLRLARDLDPFPSWLIGLEGRYLYVNREFEKQFLEPASKDYRSIIGETHATVWPDAFCRTLRNLDDLAKRVPDGHARATTNLVLGEDTERQVTVHKFPVRIRGAVVAFAGYITDILAPDEARL